MSNIDKQALRSASERDWFEDWFKREFHPDKTGPYIKDQLFFAIRAARAPLLDELEAKDKRIAELEALEAEAVYQVLTGDAWVDLSKGAMESQGRVGATVRTLYTSPPAPVSVPDEVTSEDCPAFIKYDIAEVDEAWASGFNACRAAMLQGAENAWSPTTMQTAPALDSSSKIAESPSGNSPVIPDGWVACSERMPEEGAKVLVIDGEGNKFICWHKFGFWADYRIGGNLHKINHWMPLSAAPQQEVTQALAKGMERYGDAMQELAKKEVK